MSVPEPTRDFVGYGARTPTFAWPDGATVALSIVLNYEEGGEQAVPDGDGRSESLGELRSMIQPPYRDLTAESVYEYGSRAGVWRLLRIFDDFDAPVTCFAAATALERNPEVARSIVERGHEICAHGWRWNEQWRLDVDEERKQIAAAIKSIEALTGERPVGWYSRYAPSVATRSLLVEEGGFLYDSDAYNDDIPYVVSVAGEEHIVIPYSLTYNDVRFTVAQGFSKPDDFVQLCLQAISELRRDAERGTPKMLSIGLHARFSGQAGRAAAIRSLLQSVRESGDVWVARRRDIAEWWQRQMKST